MLRLAKPRLGDNGTRAILEFVGVRDRVTQRAPRPAFEAARPEASRPPTGTSAVRRGSLPGGRPDRLAVIDTHGCLLSWQHDLSSPTRAALARRRRFRLHAAHPPPGRGHDRPGCRNSAHIDLARVGHPLLPGPQAGSARPVGQPHAAAVSVRRPDDHAPRPHLDDPARSRRAGREMLYLLSFYLPRFMNLPPREKLATRDPRAVAHQPRSSTAICAAIPAAATPTPIRKIRTTARCTPWPRNGCRSSRPAICTPSSSDDFAELQRRHGPVYGTKIPTPKLDSPRAFSSRIRQPARRTGKSHLAPRCQIGTVARRFSDTLVAAGETMPATELGRPQFCPPPADRSPPIGPSCLAECRYQFRARMAGPCARRILFEGDNDEQ